MNYLELLGRNRFFMYDGTINIKTNIDTKSFDAQIDYIANRMEDIEQKLQDADMGFEVGDTAKLEAEYEKLGNQMTNLIKKQKEIDNQGFNKLSKNIEEASNGMTKLIKKVSKWALAIFGVRSAYIGVKKAISTVSQYNEEMAAKLESMKYTIAMALEPVISRIVNLIYTALQYVNYLSKAWFGVDLFANAQEKALANSNKEAKKLKKTLAGFDTANVLSDTSTSSSGSSSNSPTSMPSLPEMKIPGWMQWLANNGTVVAGAIAGIGTAILGLNVGNLLKFTGVIDKIDLAKIIGISVAVAGIVMLIGDMKSYLENPTWENFGNIIRDIGITIVGIGITVGSLPAIVGGALAIIVGLIIGNWDTISGLLVKAKEFIWNILGWIEGHTLIVGNTISGVIKGVIKTISNLCEGLFKGIKGILDGIIKIFKGDFAGGITEIAKGLGNVLLGVLNAIISALNVIFAPIRAVIVVAGKVLGKGWTMDDISIPTIPYLATGGIVNNPGRGVPVGGAFAGESGREGVLPLTDAQTMAELGQEIGKWITVNVDLSTRLDSRVLSREIVKAQQNNSFMRNGGN